MSPNTGPGNRESGRFTARSLVEGALFAALAAVFAIIGNWIPPLFFLSFAIPVPLTIVTYRYGLPTAILSAIVAAGLSGLVGGSPGLLITVISSAAGGLAIGYGVKKGYSAIRTVLLAGVVAFFATLLQFVFSLWVLGVNLWKDYLRETELAQKQSLNLMKRFSFVPKEQLKAQEAQTKAMAKALPGLWPFILVATSLMAGLVDYWIVRQSFKRLKLGEVPAFPPFKSWRLPEWMGWLGLAAFAAAYLGTVYRVPGMGALASNLFLLAMGGFFIEGLSLTCYYFDRWGVDKISRWVILYFAIAVGIGLVVVAVAGFLDLFFDFRQPKEGYV
ncbi:MAG: YybS family protein [Chitinophagales bacterium]